MQKMEHWLGDIPSPQTRKNYANGIKSFEKYYGKPIEELLKLNDEELGHEINKYFSSLKQSHPQNTCRNRTNTVIQYLKHFGKNPKYKKSLGIFTTTLTTRDHMLTVDEAREMWTVASIDEKVMIKTWLLGLRIGDACRLEWKQFDFKPTEEPQEVLVNTKKESITAHCFVDSEFQKLLEKYIPTLDRSNKHLFQAQTGSNVKEKQMLRRLQNLQKKAGIKAKGVFGWHIGRKLFLRVAAENGVTSWNAQMMCGKAVDKGISTYINGLALKNDAIKIHNVLKMELVDQNNYEKIGQLESALKQVESENAIFKTRVDQMQKNIQTLQESMKGLYHIAVTYPTTATHHLFNKKTKKMEKWSETINTPEEEEASLKRFKEKAKKLESESH
jgi:integrase